MTRDEAITLLSCSLSELADKLEITTAAVARWDPNKIPLLREAQVRALAEGKPAIGLVPQLNVVLQVAESNI